MIGRMEAHLVEAAAGPVEEAKLGRTPVRLARGFGKVRRAEGTGVTGETARVTAIGRNGVPERLIAAIELVRDGKAVGVAVDQLGNPRANITEYCVRINSLENEADRVVRQAISTLFEQEKDPIAVLKWKEIYEAFEDGADRCEDVSNVLERIVVKHH